MSLISDQDLDEGAAKLESRTRSRTAHHTPNLGSGLDEREGSGALPPPRRALGLLRRGLADPTRNVRLIGIAIFNEMGTTSAPWIPEAVRRRRDADIFPGQLATPLRGDADADAD